MIHLEKDTKDVIRMIADIQLEAIDTIEKDPKKDADLASLYLQVKDNNWKAAISSINGIYQQIKDIPQAIGLLDEYQLLVCTHILYSMEDSWNLSHSYGVAETWGVIHSLMKKFHPEYKLLKI